MGITSTSVNLGATVHIISNGHHQIITTTTPCFVCTGGESEQRVTTNEVTITPSVFVWSWQAATNSGTKIDGSAFSNNVIVDEPGKHFVSISAVATNMPDCCDECSDSVSTNALMMQINSKPWMLYDHLDPMRTKLGVGEKVILTLLPSTESGWWHWYNPATRQNEIHFGNTLDFFQARYDTGTSIVTFKHQEGGSSASIPFDVKAPTGYEATVLGTPVSFSKGVAAVRAYIGIEWTPMDVAWDWVWGKEIGMVSTDAQGWFAEPEQHQFHDHSNWGANNPFSLVSKRDPVECTAGISWSSGGTMSWPTPAEWWIAGDPYEVKLPLPWSASQNFCITSDGTVSIEKFGTTVSRDTNDVRRVSIP